MNNPDKLLPVAPCMDLYKSRIQSHVSLEIIGDTWYPTASMRTLKYFLADDSKNKSRVHQLDFIEAFLPSNVKH